jgi:hypothetical protein
VPPVPGRRGLPPAALAEPLRPGAWRVRLIWHASGGKHVCRPQDCHLACSDPQDASGVEHLLHAPHGKHRHVGQGLMSRTLGLDQCECMPCCCGTMAQPQLQCWHHQEANSFCCA